MPNFFPICRHHNTNSVLIVLKCMWWQKLKDTNAALVEEFGWCVIDGHKQKIGNFRVEPPGLFRGRGDHPKQGMLKTRTMPEEIMINCSK